MEQIIPYALPVIIAAASFVAGYTYARIQRPDEIAYSADTIHITASSPRAARAAFALAIKSRLGIKRYDDQD